MVYALNEFKRAVHVNRVSNAKEVHYAGMAYANVQKDNELPTGNASEYLDAQQTCVQSLDKFHSLKRRPLRLLSITNISS
uniref:Uncharacterized protein n=1 Tax=Parascaris equorum TaxID=6256 RepID=A0A914R1B7_PAREQ